MKVEKLPKTQKIKIADQSEDSQVNLLPPAKARSWLGSWEEWASVIGLLVMLLIVVWSVTRAQWVTPQPALALVLVLALLAGLLLAKSRIPGIPAHILAVVLGAGLVMWQLTNLQPEPAMAARFTHVLRALQSWWQAASSGRPSPGMIQVALMLSYFTWLVGYVSIWFLLRRRNPWVAVSLGAIGLLVNLSNLGEKDYWFFLLYLLAALFMVAQTTSAKHYLWFGKHPIHYRKWGMKYLLISVLCLSVLTLSLAWLMPGIRVHSLEALAKTKMPWREKIESYWQDFFATVPGKKPVLIHGGEGILRFAGPLDLSKQVLFIVKTERPSYWRTRVYDTYTSQSWLTNPTDNETLEPGLTKANVVLDSQHSELTYTVISLVYTDVLLSTGEFASSSMPVAMKKFTPLVFNIELTGSSGGNPLPSDIASLASTLKASLASGSMTETQVVQRLREDLRLVEILRGSKQISSIKVARRQSGPDDVIALYGSEPLTPEQHYTATVRIPEATAEELSAAGENYPLWVTDRYLQLPSNFPKRVRQLAEDLTRDAQTPYAKAAAIKEYLSHIPYNVAVEEPPPEADGVEYFLFTQKTGHCVYFASAMTVMLRSVGVPARLSVGYLPGQWDAGWQGYLIEEQNFHAWPEIYFPGHGWVEFEATPGRGLNTGQEAPLISDEEGFGEDIDETLGEITPTETSAVSLPWIILGIMVLILMLGLVSYRRLARFSGLSTASTVYARMCLLASLVKLGPQPQQTAFEYSTRLSAAFPQQAGAISSIVDIYVVKQYSRNKILEASQGPGLQESWHQVRRAILKRLFRLG